MDGDENLAGLITSLIVHLNHAEEKLREGKCGFELRRQTRDLLRIVANTVHASMPQRPVEYGFSASGPPPEYPRDRGTDVSAR